MLTFPDYESFDALGLASLIKSGVLTPHELLEAAIERIEQRNPTLNAVIHKMYDQARLAIQQNIPQGLFQNVPFLLKDLFADCEGIPMQLGSRFAKGYISAEDSELVKRFKQSGLIILGKTNTPELGLSPTTEPELFGPTPNPWDLNKSAGGSSGGSAVAVASGMVPMAHGGDGAGSIRIPAAYCGVFGFKPGRDISPNGSSVMRFGQGLEVEHVITRSVRDSAAMLDVLSMKSDSQFLTSLQKPLKPLTIGMITQPFFPSMVDAEYQEALNKTALLCEDLGHSVEESLLEINSVDVRLAFLIVIAAEAASSLSVLAKIVNRKEDYRELETATAILCEVGEHFTAKDFAWASHELDKASNCAIQFFERYDLLLSLTMPLPPPNLGELKPDRLEMHILELSRRIPYGPLLRKLVQRISSKYFAYVPFTPLFNISGQPAMSVPLYWDKKGLPIGMQFAAARGNEKILFQLANQLEEVRPWKFKKPAMSF